ncbi:hypothetical protein HW555_003219 [Spodoptera exigua]|uniref:DDE Tnp4 domain-containing protein n=1 Tax=Spodoptera exigua TaxID=7107 RepID=A0A835L6F2_SPOEX|nr:hypothetical protein HW555_003219 [Spodoptera exigua]
MDIDMIDLMDLEDLDMLETSRRSNRRRYRRNPFESSEEDFKYKYRFTKRFGAKIVDILREDLCHDPRGCPLSPELQVVCALRNWARHEIQDDTADLHGVSQPVVSKSCKMVVCDADLKIMDIVTRWRGSVHDSRIFRECRLKQRFEAGAFSGILLGDSGYPCTPYLFTPLLNPTTPQEERYNRSHIRTRNTVERCFGLLKQRFRCLLRGMFGDIETAKKTIVACAVLHNIAIDMREDLFPGEEDNIEPSIQFAPSETVQQGYFPSSVRGNIRRRQFIETHFE